MSGYLATLMDMSVLEFPADWKKYGRAAGPIRNTEMLVKGKPDLVIAFHYNLDRSKGTKDMIQQSLNHGVDVIIIDQPYNPQRADLSKA